VIASPTRMESGRSRPGPWPSRTDTKYALAFDESAILARCGTSAGRLRNASPSDARPERASSGASSRPSVGVCPPAPFPAVTYGPVPAVIANCNVGPRAFAHAGRARTARRLSRSCAQSLSLAKPRSKKDRLKVSICILRLDFVPLNGGPPASVFSAPRLDYRASLRDFPTRA